MAALDFEVHLDIDEIVEMLKEKGWRPVKHGRWEPWDLTWGRSIYYCTSCCHGCEVPTEMEKPIYDYCPNCGAKMDEEDGHDDHL